MHGLQGQRAWGTSVHEQRRWSFCSFCSLDRRGKRGQRRQRQRRQRCGILRVGRGLAREGGIGIRRHVGCKLEQPPRHVDWPSGGVTTATLDSGSGFIGSRVCQTLAGAGCSVVSVSRTGAPPAWAAAQPWSRQVEWLAADALADGFAESELTIGRIDGTPHRRSARDRRRQSHAAEPEPDLLTGTCA